MREVREHRLVAPDLDELKLPVGRPTPLDERSELVACSLALEDAEIRS